MPQQMFLRDVMARLQGLRRTEHVVCTYKSGEDVQVLRLIDGGIVGAKKNFQIVPALFFEFRVGHFN